MKGMYGAMLISLGIFIAIMGGYLLNAETVPSCVTEWEYVTDISGAFQGDTSDMDVAYNPAANVTGYSYLDAENDGWISAVHYQNSDYTNAYPIFESGQGFANLTATVTSDGHDGRSTPEYTINSMLTITGEQPKDFGLHNSEAVTVFNYGGMTAYGAFAVPLSKIVEALHGTDYSSMTISMQSVSGFPCIASYYGTVGLGSWTHNGSSMTSVLATFNALQYSSSVTVYPQTWTVSIAGETISIEKAYLVFGQAQYNAYGSYGDSVSLTVVAVPYSPPAYMDPAMGVTPYIGTYTTSDVQVTAVSGSSSPTMTMTFNKRAGSSIESIYIHGSVSFTSTTDVTGEAFSYEFINEGGPDAVMAVTINGSRQVHTLSLPVTLEIAPQGGGAYSITSGSASFGTATMAAVIASITVDSTESHNAGTFDVVVTKDDGNAVSSSGFGSWTADLSYRTTSGTETQHSFDKAYWHNGEDNVSVQMAFVADGTQGNRITFRGASGVMDMEYFILHDASGWHLTSLGTVYDIGEWPAILVDFRVGTVEAYPISKFNDFTDFKVVNVPVSFPDSRPMAGLDDPEVLTSFVVRAELEGVNLRMGVTSTVVRIHEGGLYLQDGAFDLRSSFPEADAVSITIGSTAHLGDSITFSSGSARAVIPVNADRTVTIGTKTYPLNGVTFRWYSVTGPSATVGDATYAPGVYHNGKFYAAGKIWAEVKGGEMLEILTVTGDDWTMTLDGVWAPAVNMYDGHNEASSKTELMDFTHGIFRWDKNDFLIVLMGVVVIGGVIGAYLKYCTTADWVVIGLSVAVIWLIL